MIIYNTTFHVEDNVLNEFLCYLLTTYIPQAIATGFLHQPSLKKVLHTQPDQGNSLSLQFHVKNIDTLNYWLEYDGVSLHKALTNCFGSKIVGFSTLLEEMDIYSEKTDI